MRGDSASQTVPPALWETNFSWMGPVRRGKVRDSYMMGNSRILIATDRLSAFDRIITTVPGKGQVLTAIASYWFARSRHVVANHLIAVLDPSVMLVREVQIVPVEVVVRGYLAGSAWRDYEAGRTVSGHRLATGLSQFEQLPQPLVTPSTKEENGNHDVPISELEILTKGLVTREQWEQIRALALELFEMASSELKGRGLILADTKYEFGILNGEIVLADEIHTLDSSRFWVEESYQTNLSEGRAPEMLDKEPVRRWLIERGFAGEGEPPQIDDAYRMHLREHYARSAERITGQPFTFDCSEPTERISRNIKAFLENSQLSPTGDI